MTIPITYVNSTISEVVRYCNCLPYSKSRRFFWICGFRISLTEAQGEQHQPADEKDRSAGSDEILCLKHGRNGDDETKDGTDHTGNEQQIFSLLVHDRTRLCVKGGNKPFD